jgi:hypothetical protein
VVIEPARPSTVLPILAAASGERRPDSPARGGREGLADDGSSGQVTALLCSDAFRFPTAVAVSGSRLLVVNAQLDAMGGHHRLPFTVVEVAAPPGS